MKKTKNSKELEKIKKPIIKVLKKYKIKKAGIFGSFVRNEQKKNSDVDILIQPTKDMSLLLFIHVKHELEDKLHKKIDLVSYKGIHPLLKKQILQEEVKII
ncbi:MAG: nucleotidyltransferase domain-containing protein [Candidatus Woesearchaeota archaeon]